MLSTGPSPHHGLLRDDHSLPRASELWSHRWQWRHLCAPKLLLLACGDLGAGNQQGGAGALGEWVRTDAEGWGLPHHRTTQTGGISCADRKPGWPGYRGRNEGRCLWQAGCPGFCVAPCLCEACAGPLRRNCVCSMPGRLQELR